MKIQMRLNKRIFAVEISDKFKDEDIDTIREEAHQKLIEQVNKNNELLSNIFFEELEFVCSECGISLNYGEDEDATMCLQCEYKDDCTECGSKETEYKMFELEDNTTLVEMRVCKDCGYKESVR